MDFNEVAIFIKVIQKGSFTAAAQALNMPKSTVSAKIASLERRLGVSLITRSTRKIRLTSSGEAFYLRSTKAIDEIVAAETAVRSENVGPQGKFRITAPVDIGNAVLPSLATSFLKKYPRVELEIVLSDLNVNFLGDNIDLAIRAGGLKDSALIAKKVGEVGFKLYASAKYLKENGTPKNLNELKNHTGILFMPLWNDGWTLKNEKKSYQVKTDTKITVNNMKLTHGLTVDGAGIALLPSFLCEADVKAGKLLNILQDFKSEIAPLHFVYPAQKFVPPTVKAFIEFSSELLKGKFHFEN